MKKYMLLVFIVSAVNLAVAISSDFGIVRGTIISFNKKTVTIKMRDGNERKIPRSSIPNGYAIKEGATIVAYLDLEKEQNILKN